MVKKILSVSFLSLMLGVPSLFADDMTPKTTEMGKTTTGEGMAMMTPEMRQSKMDMHKKMADMHMKMADCFKMDTMDKMFQDCKEQAMKMCPMAKTADCPMMMGEMGTMGGTKTMKKGTK